MTALKFFTLFLVFSLTIILSTPELHAEMPWKCVANCGSGSSGGGGSAPRQTYTPQDNSWQQQQQQREEEERKRLEAEQKKLQEEQAEKEKKRREEFEKGKQDALKLLKGSDTSELGLKGFDAGNDLSFKETEDSSNQDSSIVDLRHLDPNKPITVDPNVVKGKERKIPVQVMEKTLNNENYIKGFDAVKAGNHSLATKYFRRALAELPDDVMVRNALGLAEDLDKMHKEKETGDTSNMANREAYKGYQAMLDHDYDTAIKYYESAAKIDPNNKRHRDDVTFLQGVKTGVQIGIEKAKTSEEKVLAEKAWKLYDNAYIATTRGDYDTAVSLLEGALSMSPLNKGIQDTLDFVKKNRDEASNSQGKNKKSLGE